MAKKRKSRKGGKRRGRVGASTLSLTPAKKESLVTAFGVALGVVGARFLETYASKQLTSLTTNMVAGIEVGLGGTATVMATSPIVKGIAMGITAAGLANLAKGMGLVSGVGAPIVFPTRRVGSNNGSGIPMIGQPYYNVPRVGAMNNGNNMYASVGRSRVSGSDLEYAGTYG